MLSVGIFAAGMLFAGVLSTEMLSGGVTFANVICWDVVCLVVVCLRDLLGCCVPVIMMTAGLLSAVVNRNAAHWHAVN